MNIDAYNQIIETIDPILTQKNFKYVQQGETGYYKDDVSAIRVVFVENNNVFELQKCDLDDNNNPSESYTTLSSWLFLPEYTVKDAKSIANDFSDTLKENFGLKTQVAVNRAALPEKTSKDEHSINTFTARFLTIFPQFKDKYTEYVTTNGTFLYVKFYSEIGAVHLKELLRNNDKKRLEKYFDALNIHYCLGDKDVRALISSVIIVEALGKDETVIELARAYMADYKYLLTATENSLALYKKGLSKNAQ